MEFTQEQIDKALINIETMDQETMCRLWRFQPTGSIYFQNALAVSKAFHSRLFIHFGGFTPEISKKIGYHQPIEMDTYDLSTHEFNFEK